MLATHLTWRYKGNKSESWDHFEGPYLRASVRKENKERLRCKRLGLNFVLVGSNTLSRHTHSLYYRIMVNMVETCL